MMNSEKRHIAFYCSSLSWGGLEMNLLRYARWMQERGHRITCLLVNNSPLIHEARQQKLSLVIIKRNRKYFDMVNAWRVARLFRKLEVDVVWFRDNRDLSVLGWAKIFSNRTYKLLYQQAMQLGISKRDPIHTMRFSHIDAWISPLPFLAEQVKTHTRFQPEKIHHIPLGLDITRFTSSAPSRNEACRQLGLPMDRKYVGLAGRFDPLKGQDVLLSAFETLADDHPEWDVLLTGEPTRNEGNEFHKQLLDKAKTPKLHNRVHFLPFSHEIENFYRCLHVFVMASKGETFGMVTIEAMASGCAIIGTRSSGTPQLLGYGQFGLLFAPGDARDLTVQLSVYMNNENLRLEMAGKAREEAMRKYDHHVVCRSLEQVVLSL